KMKKNPETMELLLDRRSVRQYTEEPVTEQETEALLQAGFYAPSAHAKFPTHFITVTDAAIREQLAQALPYAHHARQAPLVIAVCGDAQLSEHWLDDCAAAVMNMLIAASALGLGSCWCVTYPHEEMVAAMRDTLALPETIMPYALVTVGHAAREKSRPERVEAQRIHRERWSDPA
ncbi:MAG: nitroreductase family protein, partial [Oscillospiraceae bacterium]